MSSSSGECEAEAKARLRERVLAEVHGLGGPDRAALSQQASRLLCLQAEWLEAKAVLLYASFREELDVWPLLAKSLSQAKQVALPYYDPEAKAYRARWVTHPAQDLKPGRYGILEPTPQCETCPLNHLDLLLVPGVAFDVGGRRLGRGMGYYDRLLSAARGVTCGVAFDEQIVTRVPTAPHDVLVNRILTPSRWLAVADAGAALE